MKFLTILICLSSSILFSQNMHSPINLYLIPGMGTDIRVFAEYNFDKTLVNPIPVSWDETTNASTLDEYALVLSGQIDTTHPFVIAGVSMGGMLAMELSRIVKPEAIILISSAKSSMGLPFKVRAVKYLPVHCLLTEKMLQRIASKKRIFKEVKSEQHKLLYQNMLLSTGAKFLKWQIDAIAHWKFEPGETTPPVFHIHGKKDKVLPLR
jgi:pimeloyl-ACP methyl ester carboxylesterase